MSRAPTNDEPETYDLRYVPQRFGLNNTGVICHLNALLQALVSCPAVVRATLEGRDYLAKTATGMAFHDFIAAAVPDARLPGRVPFEGTTTLENSSAAVLRALTADLRARRPHCLYGPKQESASEGLVLLLDMLDDPDPCPLGIDVDEKTGAEKVVYEENPVARLFYHRCQAVVYCGACKVPVSDVTDIAVQFNLFHYDSLRKKPQTPAEFGEILRSRVDFLEGFRCDKCGKKAGSYRHYNLRMIPEVLVAVFNLYEDRRGRAARYAPSRVPFPGVGGTQLIYRQVAQVEHSGTRAGGHYIARGLRADGEAYHLNDTAATLSALGPTPNVYMVFYHCELLTAGKAVAPAPAGGRPG
jgi:hypothetical protein